MVKNKKNHYAKFINNAVYSETMENYRNRIDVKLVSKRHQNQARCHKTYLTMIESPCVKAKLHQCLTNLHILMLKCVLSKVLMYEFHYNYIKNKYGNNLRLL